MMRQTFPNNHHPSAKQLSVIFREGTHYGVIITTTRIDEVLTITLMLINATTGETFPEAYQKTYLIGAHLAEKLEMKKHADSPTAIYSVLRNGGVFHVILNNGYRHAYGHTKYSRMMGLSPRYIADRPASPERPAPFVPVSELDPSVCWPAPVRWSPERVVKAPKEKKASPKAPKAPKRIKPSPPAEAEAEGSTLPLPDEPASQPASLESTESYDLSDSSSSDPDFQEDPFCINCGTYIMGGDCGCTIPLHTLLEKVHK